ncbi:MAG TPA: mandelate racemase/muconate lactonizing enzyme family protein [Polyangiaceae bacterium]|nr:mandelate racemase/muconate lactonizing enzyme family protein [Polyangiaceae bacterium]
MKISKVTPHIVGDRSAAATLDRNFLFVTVDTDSGLRGLGEGGITWREEAMAGAVEAMASGLIGQDPFRTEHLWQEMFRGAFFPAGRIGCAALSAIDIALWDIKAQALGVPLYQLLGGAVRERVACYAHIRGRSADELAQDAKRRVAEGFRFLRTELRAEADGRTFEPSAAVRRGIEDFRALRAAVGDEIELTVDVHTRLDPADAIAFCRALEPYRPYFVEDPIRMENFASFRKLARHVAVPLAAGEQYASKWEFREQIEEELIDFARIDLCIVGGFSEALKIVGACETHYIKLAPHNPLGPVSTAACLHLDLAASYFGVQELPRIPGTYLEDVFPLQAPYESGHLLTPTRPGLGITFDESAALARRPLNARSAPRFARSDGSFQNW